MASAPTQLLISAEEYLTSSYRPDKEFINGVLVERGMPTPAHSALAMLVGAHFFALRHQFGYAVLPDCRTQIIERARYRIPDVMLCPKPVPKGRVCDVVPWVVIEVLSPDDTLSGTRARFLDYRGIGVSELVLMDPEECVAFRFEGGSLIETIFETQMLPTGAVVPFRSEELFAQLRQELE